MTVAHLWIGETPLPLKNGVPTSSPGQFPYSLPIYPDGLSAESDEICDVDTDPDGGFWVSAHAVIDWYE